MNSEELELSLRTEFESYLKDVLAEMKQEVADFQTKFQSEFDKHKTQLETVFEEFSSRIENDRELDVPFKESIVEHLRLARDEGASITATAIAEAEEMQRQTDAQTAVPPANYSELRDAIQDISEKDSQSAILKALVNHAEQYTPRGAFFIIKNEHFVGWRVFGKEGETDEQSVREIFFPVNSETILGASVRALSAVESSQGTHAEDSLFLNKLEFGQPEKMIAIPLVARNRGVAVLYADQGTEGAQINIEALEMLVRVAGLTVELLAASQAVKPRKEDSPAAHYEEETPVQKEEPAETESAHAAHYQMPETSGFESNFEGNDEVEEFNAPVQHAEVGGEQAINQYSNDYQFQSNTPEFEEDHAQEFDSVEKHELPPIEDEENEDETASTAVSLDEDETAEHSWHQPDAAEKVAETAKTAEHSGENDEESAEVRDFSFEPVEETVSSDESFSTASATNDFEISNHQPYDFSTDATAAETEKLDYPASEVETPQFESNYQTWNSGAIEEPKIEAPSFEPAVETANEYAANAFETNQTGYESFVAAPVETVAEKPAPPAKSRLSERNVDLPIEVSEDERRSHNDARRFARLLVSEIKLYNEQKVKEGRETNDLYDRLREAIDRSREMYDKRVQAPVAAKFDYFHYELVNNLAEGGESKLGSNYPGATA